MKQFSTNGAPLERAVGGDVSIIVPVYNEEVNLPELIARTVTVCQRLSQNWELIFVDDGSRDASRDLLQQAARDHAGHIVCVLLNRNYGQHSALMAGFAQARGEFIVTLDADLQNPPEEIPRLVAKAAEGYDVVGTVRVNRDDSGFRLLASSIVNKVTAKATGVAMHDYGCMLRAYRRNIVQAMLQCHERSTFIPVLANSFARNATEIDVAHAARTGGESKYSVWKLINLQFDLLTGITTVPLRLLSILGGVVSFIGIGFGIALLIMRLAFGTVWAEGGVFTLFAILFIFTGLQFIGMGMLGEYIGRIYHDVRARPRYFIEQISGESLLPEQCLRSNAHAVPVAGAEWPQVLERATPV